MPVGLALVICPQQLLLPNESLLAQFMTSGIERKSPDLLVEFLVDLKRRKE